MCNIWTYPSVFIYSIKYKDLTFTIRPTKVSILTFITFGSNNMWFTFTFTSIIITRFMNASFFNTPTFCKRNGSNKKFHNVNANLQVHFGIFESCTKVGYGQIITVKNSGLFSLFTGLNLNFKI